MGVLLRTYMPVFGCELQTKLDKTVIICYQTTEVKLNMNLIFTQRAVFN